MAIVESKDLFDFEGYRRELAETERAALAFAVSTEATAARIKASYSATQDEIKQLVAQINGINLGSANGGAGLAGLGDQAAKATKKIAEYRQRLADIKTAQDASKNSVNDLTKMLALLEADYKKLDPSQANFIQQQTDIAAKVRLLSSTITVYNSVLKEAKKGNDTAEGSYAALSKQTADLRARLREMPGAFDLSSGAINRNNAAAVAMQEKIQAADKSLKAMDASLGNFTRNVGDYKGGVSGVVDQIQTMAAGLLTLDAAFQAVSYITTITADFQKYEAVLTNTLGSQQAAAEAMDLIQRFAAKTPYSVNELTESYVKLANRGFVPTEKELTKLADLAASTGKPFDQLVEAILDAQTGEFERLKEFGIGAQKVGDQIRFSFKGQATTVKATGDQIQQYILSLGTLKGVAGSTADISATLTGQLSNLGDASNVLLVRIGNKLAPFISLIGTSLTAGIQKLSDFFKTANDLAKDGLGAYEDQKNAVTDLNKVIVPLLDRYDQLSEKARALGGESKLSKGEQVELRNAIVKVSDVIPSAISAQNNYGQVMAINTGIARDYITEQERVATVLNADSIHKYNEALALTKQRMQNLQQQLVVIQGATPTPNGGPAVSVPTNNGQSTGFPIAGLNEAQRASAIVRIQKELVTANEEAKNLAATVDYLSGKAPKPASAIPANKPSTLPVGKTKTKDPKKEADEQLKLALDTAKKEAEVTASALDTAYAAGAETEVDYLNKRLTILQEGILKEQALLVAAGKENSNEYKDTQKRLNETATEYLGKRAKLEDDAFKAVIEATKAEISTESQLSKSRLNQRLSELEIAYNQEETVIKLAVARNEITVREGEKRLYELRIQYLEDTALAIADNSQETIKLTKTRLDDLEAQLRAAGKTEIEIAKAVKEEKDKILKEEVDAKKAAADAEVKISAEKKAQEVKHENDLKDAKKRLSDQIIQDVTAAGNAYFDITNANRQADLDNLDKQKANELLLAGDNAKAKTRIEQDYARKTADIKRKQAIADKEQAAFNIILSTGVAIVRTLADTPFPYDIPLAIAVGALGAIQLATVLAKPIPAFKDGKSRFNPYSGPALAGEAGTELFVDREGASRLLTGPTLINTRPGDTIFTASETARLAARWHSQQAGRQAVGDAGLMNAATARLQTGRRDEIRFIMQGATGPTLTKKDMHDAFAQALDARPEHITQWDEDGMHTLIRKGHSRTEYLNRRFRQR